MSLNKKPMRYAHPEGHTDVCYFSGEKGGLITCGSDGDVRSWLSLMDDDPATSCVSEQATTVISKNGKIYVGNDNNTVQILTYPDLEKEGIVTRFAATISALATTKQSKLIASGACDMRIHVTNIETLDTIELTGHDAPILGLSLDPKEEFVASSSADGTIRVWNIKEKRSVHTWNNVVPKCNSFLTAKVYCAPSFHCKTGDFLAYPHGKDVIAVERSTWKENFRLKCPDLKTELSICKFSECGTRLAASSFYGELIVWDVESKSVIGYIEHQQNAKITSFSWNPEKPKEIAFCDALGQLGCIEVRGSEKSLNDLDSEAAIDENNLDNNSDFPDDDDDAENVISLNKIKSSVNFDHDQKSVSDVFTERIHEDGRKLLPEINLQEPFQPSSTPVHLLSRYMVWNDTGLVMCFTSEDGEESNIEVQFHDVAVHHSMRISNYLRHTVAALSPQALALCCASSEDTASKLVVVVLNGWGSGNKEWTIDLPEGEEAQSLAVGNNFVAVATDRRNLRLFMIGGTQREIIALPGSVVSMNAHNNHLLVTYHTGIGASEDQHMNMLWMRIIGPNLRSQKLEVPLSPSSKLSWLGLSDLYSPTIMDTDGIIKMYDKKSSMWRVACNTDRHPKGKMDHFFVIGVSESERLIRCILCKGSYYPPTNPRPILHEIPLIIPLCEPDSEKSEKEAKVWQLGSHPEEEKEAVLMLIALACRSNVEFRAVELCQQIASQKVIELAIKYAARNNRMALANKLESIGEDKGQQELEQQLENDKDCFENQNNEIEEELDFAPIVKKTEIEIRPISLSQGQRRSNPFLKRENAPKLKGLAALGEPEEPQKPKPLTLVQKPKPTKAKKSESFVSWFSRNKKHLQEEFPDISITELTKLGLSKFKESTQDIKSKESPQVIKTKESSHDLKFMEENAETKKRKLSESEETTPVSEPKRSASSKLAAFANDK